jgi:hypothetical protein
MQTTVVGRRCACVCVPDDDARRRRLLCLACHGDAVLRRSFVRHSPCARSAVRGACAAWCQHEHCRGTVCPSVCCCCRAWPGDCAPWRYNWSLGFVGRQSSCCCSCRCEVDKARSSAASCCSGAARCRRSRARARRRRSLPVAGKSECVRPVGSSACAEANGGTSARSSCAAAFERRRGRARECRRWRLSCALLATRRRRAELCARRQLPECRQSVADVCRDRPPAALTLERASIVDAQVPPNLRNRLALRRGRLDVVLDDRICA